MKASFVDFIEKWKCHALVGADEVQLAITTRNRNLLFDSLVVDHFF
jgi:hypothetical protein